MNSICFNNNNSICSPLKEPSTKQSILNDTVTQMIQFMRIDRAIVDVVRDFSREHIVNLITSSALWGFTVISAQVLGVAFAVYIVVLNFAVHYAANFYMSSQKENLHRCDNTNFSKSTLFKNVIIGLLLTAPFFALTEGLTLAVGLIMSQLGLSSAMYQDVGVLLSQSGITGLFMILFACVIAPITEEFTFRGYLNDLFLINDYDKKQSLQNKTITQNPDTIPQKTGTVERIFSKSAEAPSSPPLTPPPTVTDIRKDPAFKTWDKFKAILKTSLVFGLMHLSPFQGWANILVFVGTTFMGLFAGILTEYTGDLWGSTTIHMLNNTLATILLRV
ncbi:MAG: hypothetical protein K1000chlam2_01216 [Chlamydiae bacterium]|nr:hypothetical protein [Chlamydiota bacterium]